MNITGILSFIKSLIDVITPTLNQITAAITIMFFGFIIGKVAGKVVLRFLKDTHKAGKDILRWDFSKEISITVTYTIYIISIIIGIIALGVEKVVVYTLVGIIVIAAIFSFFLMVKDFIPNCMQGRIIRRTLKKGDVVTVDTIKGEIISSDLLTTTLRRKNGEILIIPNSIFPNITKK